MGLQMAVTAQQPKKHIFWGCDSTLGQLMPVLPQPESLCPNQWILPPKTRCKSRKQDWGRIMVGSGRDASLLFGIAGSFSSPALWTATCPWGMHAEDEGYDVNEHHPQVP
jgi:hypothetical protein